MPEDQEDQTVTHSVYSFVKRAQELYKDEDKSEFVKFTLTGNDSGRQVFVDTLQNRMGAQESYLMTRDYDSVLGISTNVMVNQSLQMHPVCRFEETLKHNVHLKHTFTNSKGTFSVPIHKIPNVDPHSGNPCSHILSQEHFTTFYNKGLRPALEALDKVGVAEWPPSYTAEMFRAT
ncbi:hypothetical protein M422DRAFT_251152 [Sphaerobolus stellatus SS14]|uniref:Uncharacterized protein n=1 Tax=Sphaerobolus stellatus (strain SS14) TaxID=990650 RepID=A0A0C9VEC3_SPHS4|nr:hypothetical protein M422DRAFT_251152 [Sphaerobolus stellatus SS14]